MRSGALPLPKSKNGFAVLTTGAVIAVGVVMITFTPKAANADDAVSLSVETEASYTLSPSDSKPIARKLALFRAKRKAADQAADRFAAQKLIQFVDRDKNELVCLVTDRLDAELLQDQCRTDGHTDTCFVQAITRVRLSDFIDAQLTSLRMGAEDEADYREEMAPEIAAPFRPGLTLAKAYRLIHKKEWRMAIIYLDRITQRYPNWREAYEVKAVALNFENQFNARREALQHACALGSSTACAYLR